MKLTITNFLILVLLAAELACCSASVSKDQVISIDMYGTSKKASSAAGDRDPKFQSYQLLTVDLVSVDGASKTSLFNNDDERIFLIIDREQTIFSKKIDDLLGKSYGGIQVGFAASITGGDKDYPDYSFAMAEPNLSISQGFAVETAKSIGLVIKINWGSTLSESAMSQPDYELSIP